MADSAIREAELAAAREEKLAARDLSVDFVRAVCIVLVVVLHTMMVGLSLDSSGAVTQVNPLEDVSWFGVASWFGQIMPLFFVAGGFASWMGWRSVTAKGGGWADYVRSRAVRLLFPVAIFYGIWFVLISLAVAVFAVPVALVDMFLAGIGMPLWFIVAYIICQVFTPVMIRAHLSRPFVTVAVLFGGVAGVDLVASATGIAALGLLNMAFVWLLVTQFGFFIASPVRHVPRWLLGIGVIVGFGATAAVVLAGWYHPSMLTNLNPPKLPLVFIGFAWACLYLLLRTPIRRLMRTRVARMAVYLVGSRAMTIYLWHLPVIVLLSALVLVFPNVIPAPGDDLFWVSRFVLLVPVFAIVGSAEGLVESLTA